MVELLINDDSRVLNTQTVKTPVSSKKHHDVNNKKRIQIAVQFNTRFRLYFSVSHKAEPTCLLLKAVF
jgi:hypothetical protein